MKGSTYTCELDSGVKITFKYWPETCDTLTEPGTPPEVEILKVTYNGEEMINIRNENIMKLEVQCLMYVNESIPVDFEDTYYCP